MPVPQPKSRAARRLMPAAIGLALGVGALTVTGAPAVAASAQLFDNGGLNPQTTASNGTAAPTGSFFSELQHNSSTDGNATAGVSVTRATPAQIADDFLVPNGVSWSIDSIVTFAYQTGQNVPMTDGALSIWSGPPNLTSSTRIFGDDTTDRLTSSTATGVYRLFDATGPSPSTPGTTRPIYQNTYSVAPALTLAPGTYWIVWDVVATGSNSVYAPPVTIPGVRSRAGSNALQNLSGTWSPAQDTGVGTAAGSVPVEFPFKVTGASTSTVPPPTTPVPPSAPAPVAPQTGFSATPKAKTTKKKATFSLTADQAGSTFTCSLNGAAYTPCATSLTVAAKKGSNTLSARATSTAGLTDATPATYSWRYKKKRKHHTPRHH